MGQDNPKFGFGSFVVVRKEILPTAINLYENEKWKKSGEGEGKGDEPRDASSPSAEQ
jgi:hypothetical protein